jgi:serine/threonine protein phosphatase 1
MSADVSPANKPSRAWSLLRGLGSKSTRAGGSAPAIPHGLRVYAIGDIHGRADLLNATFAAIDAHITAAPEATPIHVFLGDYVDRGPFVRDAIGLLIDRGMKYPCAFLKGNHEHFIIEFLKNPEVFLEWRHYGAFDTLISYGLTPPLAPNERQRIALSQRLNESLPEMHRGFLRMLRSSFSCGDYFFVHAGVRPGISLEQQREEDLLWIRDDFLFHEDAYEKLIVHGHTPVMNPDIRPNRINIDTGAYATGRLTCLVLEKEKMSFI